VSILAGIQALKHALESGDVIAEIIIEKGREHPWALTVPCLDQDQWGQINGVRLD